MKFALGLVLIGVGSSFGCAAPSEDNEERRTESAFSASTEIDLPVKLTCQFAADGRGVTNVLHTRLGAIHFRSQLSGTPRDVWSSTSNRDEPQPDEVAYGWRGEYYGAYVSETEYRYNVWTCDSEDRSYSFRTEDLIVPGGSTGTREVAGRLNISIRGEGENYDLLCRAEY